MTNDDELLSRYFDTRLEHDLPENLRREEARLEEMVDAIRPVSRRLPQSIRPAVMARVRALPVPVWRRAWRWLTASRPVAVSPLGALGLAAAAVAVILLARPARPRVAAPVAAATEVVTRFTFVAPGASSVAITGDFAHWSSDGVALERQAEGVWTVDIPLSPGIHQYTFVVDGERWMPDPHALWSVDDGFGNRNSVTMVSPPASAL